MGEEIYEECDRKGRVAPGTTIYNQLYDLKGYSLDERRTTKGIVILKPLRLDVKVKGLQSGIPAVTNPQDKKTSDKEKIL